VLVPSSHGDVKVVKSGVEFSGRVPYWTHFYLYKDLIVDTGCPHTAVEVREFLGERKGVVLLTHHHEDHIGGAIALQGRLKIFAPLKSLPLLEHPPELPDYRKLVWGQPQPLKAHPLPSSLCFGGLEVEVFETPGHTFDHVSFLVDGKLFAGDLVVAPGQMVCMRQEELRDTMISLRKILKLDFEYAYTGVGVFSKEEVKAYLEYLGELRKKVEELHRKGKSPRDIVKEVFPHPPEIVQLMEVVSDGEWSRENMVRSLLGLPR